ncbi:hypothetical protein [Oceanobacillus sp. Castelsardo]|uniref:hypothetical protein n=1 Tax=Oceanobacillus sp. Castelsardo TaxID=1851204 RepID=UPI000837EFEB|nr:hypothetical protein [Oceanobacillus sp. Castelsardo]
MRSPLEKFTLIEILSIGIAAVVGLFAMIQGYLILLFLTFYLIAISLICEAFIFLQRRDTAHAGKQLVRAICILIFITYTIFQI